MKLATSTNIVCERPGNTIMPLEQTLRLANKAGFTRFDISFYDWALPNSPFLTDNWKEWILSIAKEARRLGVVFYQSHLYTYDFLDSTLSEDELNNHQMLVERSLECCSILKAEVCVSHLQTDFSEIESNKNSLEKNIEYFKNLMEKAKKFNIQLAVENNWDSVNTSKKKFGVNPEEIVEFICEFNDPDMGICWDFEHAYIMGINQVEALKIIGKNLFATHISDTHSNDDHDYMHVLPCMGKTNWKEIIPVLKEIDYTRDFCFEAHNFIKYLPDEVIGTALQLSFEIGQYLMTLYK